MKVLITGGCGYLGHGIVEAISHLDAVDEIVIYDNLSRKNYSVFFTLQSSKPITFVEGDILDERKLARSLTGVDAVIHLAAKVSFPFTNLDAHVFEQVNHWGTATLLNCVQKSNVKTFIYASSATVYGSTTEAVDESHPTSPITYYAASKLNGEKHVRALFDDASRQAYILRIANTYGFNESFRLDTVINGFLFESRYKKKIYVYGDGEQKRPFVHINNVGAAVTRLMDIGKLPSGTYNVADVNMSVNEITRILKDRIFPDLEIQYVHSDLPKWGLMLKTPCTLGSQAPIDQDDLVAKFNDINDRFRI